MLENFKIRHLPHWVLTDLQPAFYDLESVTSVEETARLYAKMQELITLYNEFTDRINKSSEVEIGFIDNGILLGGLQQIFENIELKE